MRHRRLKYAILLLGLLLAIGGTSATWIPLSPSASDSVLCPEQCCGDCAADYCEYSPAEVSTSFTATVVVATLPPPAGPATHGPAPAPVEHLLRPPIA